MQDIVITGASRGIGRALALALAAGTEAHLVVTGRDEQALATLADEVRGTGRRCTVVPGDLSSLEGAAVLGERLLRAIDVGALLVHNAGIWPTRRELGERDLESSFLVNHLGPLAMQAPLLDAGRIARILVISAGLIVKARFDADRTPTGRDFSSFRTYANTKLCLAVAMQRIAELHAELDVLVLHPGVVRTDLGARSGPIGWLLSLVKRSWERPEDCASRLAELVAMPRWSTPGQAAWFIESTPSAWPEPATDAATREAILRATAPFVELR